jgi:hypothetical protein
MDMPFSEWAPPSKLSQKQQKKKKSGEVLSDGSPHVLHAIVSLLRLAKN